MDVAASDLIRGLALMDLQIGFRGEGGGGEQM